MTSNFSVSTVATAPSPATSGTSVTVATGHGSRFSLGPAVICPAGAEPTPPTAEVVEVTAIVGDVLTIVRARESSTARTVITGDNIRQGITAGMWDGLASIGTPMPASGEWFGPLLGGSFGTQGVATGTMVFVPLWVPAAMTLNAIGFIVASAAASAVFRLGLYAPTSTTKPGTLLVDAGTVDASTTGAKTLTISVQRDVGLIWAVAVPQVVAVNYRTVAPTYVNSFGTASDAWASPGSNYWQQTGVSGALPATATATPTHVYGGSNITPMIGVRRA